MPLTWGGLSTVFAKLEAVSYKNNEMAEIYRVTQKSIPV